ncbi:hypothetical protein JL721_11737 [Aureococcus anophagefferens]|nr:hypothetical protein JL721_11737 [Aureococcus anophagefferens]
MRSREDSEEISLKHSGYAYVYTREGSLVAGGKWVRVAADLENLTLRLDNTHMTETNRDKYCKEMTITAGTTVLRAPQPGRPHCLALSDFNAASGKRRVLDCLTQEGVTAWFDLLTRVANTDLDTLLEPLHEAREKRRDGGDLEDALRSAPAKVEVALLALRRGRLPAVAAAVAATAPSSWPRRRRFAKAEDGTRCTCRATATASDPLEEAAPPARSAARPRRAPLAAGAVVDAADGDGVPPLVYAVRAGHVACVAACCSAATGDVSGAAARRRQRASSSRRRGTSARASGPRPSTRRRPRTSRGASGASSATGCRERGTALANFPADVCAAAPDDRFTALLRCCANGDGQGAELWLTLGADANHADHGPEKRTPLMACAARGDTHLAKMLLATGRCAVDARDALGCSALCRAAEAAARSRAVPRGPQAPVGWRRSKRDARGRTALFYAAEADRPENVELLLGLGRRSSAGSDAGAGGDALAEMLDVDAADDSGTRPARGDGGPRQGAVALLRLRVASRRDGPPRPRRRGAPKRPLSIALEAGDAQIAHTLGRFRASVLCGDEPATLRYVDRGNYVVDEPTGLRDGAATALLVACRLGHGPAAKRLLDAGADPNRADAAGETPPSPGGGGRAGGRGAGSRGGDERRRPGRALPRPALDAGADAGTADDACAESAASARAARRRGRGEIRRRRPDARRGRGAPARPRRGPGAAGLRRPHACSSRRRGAARTRDYLETPGDGELDVVDDVQSARPGGRCDAAEVLKAILLHHGRSPVDLNCGRGGDGGDGDARPPGERRRAVEVRLRAMRAAVDGGDYAVASSAARATSASAGDGAAALEAAARDGDSAGVDLVVAVARRRHALAELLLLRGVEPLGPCDGALFDGADVLPRGDAAPVQSPDAPPPPPPQRATTPFFVAVETGDLDAVRIFLDQRVAVFDVDAPRPDGSTALMAALARGHVAVAHALLAAGADATAADSLGRSALERACFDHASAKAELRTVAVALDAARALAAGGDGAAPAADEAPYSTRSRSPSPSATRAPSPRSSTPARTRSRPSTAGPRRPSCARAARRTSRRSRRSSRAGRGTSTRATAPTGRRASSSRPCRTRSWTATSECIRLHRNGNWPLDWTVGNDDLDDAGGLASSTRTEVIGELEPVEDVEELT